MKKKELWFRPWINEDGTKKTDEEISRLGQSWDQKIWNLFLNEDVGVPHNHPACISVPHLWQSKAANTTKSLWDRDDGGYSKKFQGVALKKMFEVAFLELIPREAEIVRAIFWSEESLSKVARRFKIWPSSLRRTKKRILEKLKVVLVSDNFREKLLLYRKQTLDHAS